MPFVGRRRELAELSRQLDVVAEGRRVDKGVAVLLRGRRRIGKSRLVTEFITRTKVASVYFQAARRAPLPQELALFAEAVASSTLPGAAVAAGNVPSTLTAALTLLAAALPDDRPTVVVLDELPWLLEGTDGAAGELQRAWDTKLSAKPVLLLLLGSDLAMMEQLTRADQPFYGRATEMVLDPLTPHDVAEMTRLDPFNALDAFLITGGLPLVAQEWLPGQSPTDFLAASYGSSTSALVVSGMRALDAEFGETTRARQVLSAIGGLGERAFTGIQQGVRGQPITAAVLTDTLETLSRRRIVARDEPLSARTGQRDRRYRIADPGLRFWLAFVEPALAEIDRGRPDLALTRTTERFGAWRGRAVEPVVRAALERLLPDQRWPGVRHVGGWWPRGNVPEIDVVAADARPASTIIFTGTIKWRESRPVSRDEIDRSAADAVSVPGATLGTPLVAVCPAGADPDPRLAATWTIPDLLEAWA